MATKIMLKILLIYGEVQIHITHTAHKHNHIESNMHKNNKNSYAWMNVYVDEQREVYTRQYIYSWQASNG